MAEPTDRIRETFEAFVAAMGLNYRPDFKSQKVMYSGMDYAEAELTEVEIMETPEFIGFVDGYSRRTPRFGGPKGARQKNQSISKDFQRMVLDANAIVSQTDPDIALTMEELNLLPKIAISEENNHPLTRYNNGYRLGCSARP